MSEQAYEIWWQCNGSSSLRPVRVTRATEKSVWILDRWSNQEARLQRRAGYTAIFPTFEEAKEHLKRISAATVERLQVDLENAKKRQSQVATCESGPILERESKYWNDAEELRRKPIEFD